MTPRPSPLSPPPRKWLDYLEWRVAQHRADFERLRTEATYELWRSWHEVFRQAMRDDAPEDVFGHCRVSAIAADQKELNRHARAQIEGRFPVQTDGTEEIRRWYDGDKARVLRRRYIY